MKDSEFIQLLNLYLDHEISGADAVRLEAEVQNNPSRRKVYQQYCRMQKACKVLAADFSTDVAAEAAAVEKKIIAFDPAAAAAAQRKRTGTFYSVGAAVAAAACVAIIFVKRGERAASTTDSQPAIAVVQTPKQVTENVPPVQIANNGSTLRQLGTRAQSTLVTDLLLTRNGEAETTVTPVRDGNDQLAWIPSVQIAPLHQGVPAEDLRFDVRPATLRPEARVLGGNRAPVEAAVEMTAFRFQK